MHLGQLVGRALGGAGDDEGVPQRVGGVGAHIRIGDDQRLHRRNMKTKSECRTFLLSLPVLIVTSSFYGNGNTRGNRGRWRRRGAHPDR